MGRLTNRNGKVVFSMKDAADRIENLQWVSGEQVSCYRKTGVTYFVFGQPNKPLKTVCTYKKARIFAEGVAIGKRLNERDRKSQAGSCQPTVGINALQEKRKELEQQTKEVEARIREIYGGFSRNGLLLQAERSVKIAEREARDRYARLVVWVTAPWDRSDDKPYIIDKVTPKRIYVRRRGQERADYYEKDGTTGTRYGKEQIDLAKTFPEGLEAYEKANKRTNR